MLKIQSDRIIIDGHEPTKEQCETMSLLANALAESNNFKTVDYRDGYAEFEKVGKAEELKFLDGPESFSMYDAATGDEVFYVGSDGPLTITFSGNELTLTESPPNDFAFILKRSNTSYVESYTPSDGYGSVNTPIVITMKKQIENIDGYVIKFGEASATPRISVDLTTLPGWSALAAKTYNITVVAKAAGYRDSEPSAAVSVEKAATITLINFTISGTSYQAEEGMTWEEWCNSGYNTGGFSTDGDNYVFIQGGFTSKYLQYEGTNVSGKTIIRANTSYTLLTVGGGIGN